MQQNVVKKNAGENSEVLFNSVKKLKRYRIKKTVVLY